MLRIAGRRVYTIAWRADGGSGSCCVGGVPVKVTSSSQDGMDAMFKKCG